MSESCPSGFYYLEMQNVLRVIVANITQAGKLTSQVKDKMTYIWEVQATLLKEG